MGKGIYNIVLYMKSWIGHVITDNQSFFLIVTLKTKKSVYLELPLLTHLHEGYIQPVCVSGFKKKSPLSSSRKKDAITGLLRED